MKGIRELAQHLDISIGTVSRALNNKSDVSEATRKRVLDAAMELGYVANQSGRSLRQGSTNAVGLMMEAGEVSDIGGDSFFIDLIAGLQSVLRKHNLDLVLLPCARDQDPNDFLRRMVARRFVDAWILSATRIHDPRIELLAQSKLPFVTLGRSRNSESHAWIDLDFVGVARHAVGRLAARGHRRIAVAIPQSDINLGELFLEGYLLGLADYAISFDPQLVCRVQEKETGGAIVGQHILGLAERPSAVVLVHELMAVGLYSALEEAGVVPGQDISIIGFRHGPQIRFLRPSLTSYAVSLYDLGVALADGLLTEIHAGKTLANHRMHRIWPMAVSAGESDGG